MAEPNQALTQVLRPGTFAELFSHWNRIPHAIPYAGGTSLIGKGNETGILNSEFQSQPELPRHILSLEKIEDLHSITRTERHLEIGAMVRLGEIIALGKIVPWALSQTLKGIAGPTVRNLATIGGNIFTGGNSIAPLCALDAAYELRNAEGSRWISAFRFSSDPKSLQKGELITRIRIPLEEWNYTIYRKFNKADSGGEGGILILIVRNQKNILTKIQAVFTGTALLRHKDSEFALQGKALPLDRKDSILYRKHWEEYLEELPIPGPLLRDKIINAVESAIAGLSG